MVRTLATLALFFCCVATSASQTAKERKNVDQLTNQEVAAYKHAIGVLKKSNDPKNNYAYHASLHNLFLSNPPHGCEHGNDLFFPWHRYHLAFFEKALQAADPNHATLSTKNVTIPYWDWTKKASGQRFPKVFENELDPGMKPNPLYNDFRETAPADPFFDEAYMTSLVRTNLDWNNFGGGPKEINEFYGAFESPAHNTMHGSYIGGTMADPTEAAMDPIYWSFHAFIDMQWDRWQKIHQKPPTSQDKVLRGFPDAPTAAMTVDVEKLNYFYKHTPESIAPLPVAVAPPPLLPRSYALPTAIVGAEGSVAVWGGKGPFTFKLIPAAAAFQRADLWFDQVRIPQSLSYQAEAFIHPGDRKYQPADSAGFINVWQGHTLLGGQAHHAHGNFFLTVTQTLRKAIMANPGKELAVTVVIMPVPPKARPKAAAAPKTFAIEQEVQFQGVRLLLDGGGPLQKAAAKGGGKHGH